MFFFLCKTCFSLTFSPTWQSVNLASAVMANDFDGQIDYLEQFGSSSVSPLPLVKRCLHPSLLGPNEVKCFHSVCPQFKESALRKQSLYLKFDPLLRESPKKCGGATTQFHVPRPAAASASVSQYDTHFCSHSVSLL